MAEVLGSDLGGIRVLVADDDPIVRDLICKHLSRLSADPVGADDGVVAWKLLSELSFDLAIVDLGMPNVDGFQLIEWMRCNSATRHMPVLVVTGREDREAVRDAFHAGASSFLVKPIDWPTFEHHLGFLLRLSTVGRKERALAQQNAAVSRARDAILGKLCQAVGTSASVLTSAAEAIRLAEGASASPETIRQLNAIMAEARAMHRLTTRVADLASIVSSEVVVEDRKEPVAELVSQALAAVAEAAQAASVELGFSLPPSHLALICNGDSILLGLVQLLRNAIAHSPPQSRVWITAQLMPDGVLAVTVSDDGIGMDPEFVASCLNPLQAHQRGVAGQGSRRTGFGLPLARAVVEAHNGNLEIRSMPGKGTDAFFVLPAERVVRLPAAPAIPDGHAGDESGEPDAGT